MKDTKKKNIKKIENLSIQDQKFIEHIFSSYFDFKDITDRDIQLLSEALKVKYDSEIARKIFDLISSTEKRTDIEKHLEKENKELYDFFLELKSTYGPKIFNSFISDLYPEGVRSFSGQALIDPEYKEILNQIEIRRNDGQSFTISQPFSFSIDFFNSIFSLVNNSIKVMMDAKIIDVSVEDLKEIEKNISEFKTYIKKLKK